MRLERIESAATSIIIVKTRKYCYLLIVNCGLPRCSATHFCHITLDKILSLISQNFLLFLSKELSRGRWHDN